MKRFSFVTGTTPSEKGEGVVWPDTMAVYRKFVGGVWTEEFAGSVADIVFKYGRNSGYEFEWIDTSDHEAPSIDSVDPAFGDVGDTVTVDGNNFEEIA